MTAGTAPAVTSRWLVRPRKVITGCPATEEQPHLTPSVLCDGKVAGRSSSPDPFEKERGWPSHRSRHRDRQRRRLRAKSNDMGGVTFIVELPLVLNAK